GWYSKSIWENIAMMFVQYWLFTLVFIIIGLVSVRFSKASLPLCIVIGIGAAIFFSRASFSALWAMFIIPLTVIGLLFFFGRAKPRRLAYILLMALPMSVLIITSIFGIVKLSGRIDDGDYGQRRVEAEGVCLIWAPRGPGWPDNGVSYYKAKEICAHLSEDGSSILDEEVGIWRLPTVEEAVASQMLHEENAGGAWDPENKKARYKLTPDKETPLWDPHSKIIYYWTDTIATRNSAYIIVYNGGVFPRRTESLYDYLSFRAVKDCAD
ncbi:MAG: DUF1566 domain-containing protein, partial [Actinomycetota bacterium]|nr:DUF1566 domain-containing protein [Actinomycetota bacterium]